MNKLSQAYKYHSYNQLMNTDLNLEIRGNNMKCRGIAGIDLLEANSFLWANIEASRGKPVLEFVMGKVDLVMVFCLHGNIEIEGVTICRNEYFCGSFFKKNIIECKTGEPSRFVFVSVSHELLNRYVGKLWTLYPSFYDMYMEGEKIAFKSLAKGDLKYSVQDLSENKDYFHRVLLAKAKVLNCLSLVIEDLGTIQFSGVNKDFIDFKPVERAREILDSHWDNSPTIPELAKQVGINETDLKKRFKELYGNTLYGYVLDKRMEYAKILLQKGNTIAEVSFSVGYKNPQHFTHAFKKKFGILPSTFKSEC